MNRDSIPGNKFHERAENIRLMIASLADNHDTGQPERSTTELLLFEISDRLAAITFELHEARRMFGGAQQITFRYPGDGDRRA